MGFATSIIEKSTWEEGALKVRLPRSLDPRGLTAARTIMATELEQKPAPASPKHETYVERELAKARGRIRVLDAGVFFLLFLVATLGYGFLLILCDRALELSTAVRLTTFVCYVGVGGYFLVRSALCLLGRVNPYYAARQLEQTLPEAKNSIINWLDLRDEKLPAAIRSSLGLRAAKDLK